MKKKWMAWALIGLIGITSVPAPEYAEAAGEEKIKAAEMPLKQPDKKQRKKWKQKEETVYRKVQDLDAFLEAAVTVTQEDSNTEPENKWQKKRLLVKGAKEFDSMGANSVIRGYDQLSVLDYATEEAAKAAYRALKQIPGLIVETDGSYETDAEKSAGKTEGNTELLSGAFEEAAKHSGEKEVVAAVLDTGYDIKSYGENRIKDGVDLISSGGISDENGHGTAMANLILSHTPDCVKVMPVKAADENGRTSALKLYMGIRYAAENKADIIHISMSAYQASGSKILSEAIREAEQRGIPVIVSAGNAKGDVSDFSPANVGEAIVVSAVGRDKAIAEYSNRGSYVDYCSYGSMRVLGLNGTGVKMEGTSVAAALVSAVIAKEKAYGGWRNGKELTEFLEREAEDLGVNGKDELYGLGLILPDFPDTPKEDMTEDGFQIPLLSCDWKNISAEELNGCIGQATNLERRVFLDGLSEEERAVLLSKQTLFSEEVIYSENTFEEDGTEKEKFRIRGRLYDIVMNEEILDEYEVQTQKYHVFAYGSNKGTRSCIRLDTDANDSDATVYCWLKDRSSDHYNSGEYGITFAKGSSSYDFEHCTHKIENCDRTDTGNPVVWRLKIRNVKISKPTDMAVNYNSGLWNKSTFQITGNSSSGYKKNYWYIFHYQVRPASGEARQKAYGDGAYHGGFWDLESASAKKCGFDLVTTTIDIGSRDLYTDQKKDGITYRLPLIRHKNAKKEKDVIDEEATCIKTGSRHTEVSYQCADCDRKWTEKKKIREIPQLSHSFLAKKSEDNGIADGKYWEECTKNCGGRDVNGEYWQKNIRYLHPVRYWLMGVSGTYAVSLDGTDRTGEYYAQGETVPSWSITPSEEFLEGKLASFLAPQGAACHDVYVPRKQYTVQYDGNGAKKGNTLAQTIYCGEVFDLRKNGFLRPGFQFAGWSRQPEGEAVFGEGLKNLSLTHNEVVTLYALWQPSVFRIFLDHQGANKETGTRFVYEKYGEGYYRDAQAETKFWEEKIRIPQKEKKDASLLEGIRKCRFMGYYTGRNGTGHKMAEKDGSLTANINDAGDYKYFSGHGSVYAKWEDMYAVQFHPNLSEADRKLLTGQEEGEVYDEPVVCPFTRWKEKGGSITIGFGEAVVKNKTFADIYRLKGWSLTPEIESDDEIVLSKDRCAYTFTADEDVTFYAQWNTDVFAAYTGNGQTKGDDCIAGIGSITDSYTFMENHFEKSVQKPATDVVFGRTEDADKKPYTETVFYSFQGWSMAKEKKRQGKKEVFCKEQGDLLVSGLVLAAKKTAEEGNGEGITFGNPALDYGACGMKQEEFQTDAHMPFLNFYAVWDQYPQIRASDLYLPLSDAKRGVLTEDYLLSLALATDEELKTETNPDGKIKHGIDAEKQTSFTVLDYQESDFTGADQEMSLTVTYRAEDCVGNVSTKMIRIYLTDMSGKDCASGAVRFISAEYADTLAENSVWRTGEYAEKLKEALKNKKTGEEYTSVTKMEKALGIKPARKPGSGNWDHVQEVWRFTHKEILNVQEYVESGKYTENDADFLKKFGSCRVK